MKSSQKKSTDKSLISAKPKSKGGPKTLLTDEIAYKIVELAAEGRTERQIADIIGVHVNTIYNWKKGNQALLWALREAKMEADELVEASLYRRATGCIVPDEKIFLNKEGEIVRVKTFKAHPPDATSMIFWLKNRKPDVWRDKVEFSVDDSTPLIIHAGDESEEI